MKFLDSTVLPDLLLSSNPYTNKGLSYLSEADEAIAISVIAVPVFLRMGRKAGVTDRTLQDVLSICRVVDVDEMDYWWACGNERAGDFHGALQVAAAIRTSCSGFVTNDGGRAQAYGDRIAMAYVGSDARA